MGLKNNKSTWATLATLSVTAIAAGTTALIKYRRKQKRRQAEEQETALPQGKLTAEQDMVYNEAVRAFISLNDRIYGLRLQHKELQPIIQWLATDSEKPTITTNDEQIVALMEDIEKFLITEVPFINACVNTISDDGTTYADYIRAAVGRPFDPAVDIEYNGTEVPADSTIKYVLKLGYFFPESRIAYHPVKSIVIV